VARWHRFLIGRGKGHEGENVKKGAEINECKKKKKCKILKITFQVSL
jgi:hypothetical protein